MLYFESYIVIDPGDVPDLKERELIADERYRQLVQEYPGRFTAKMGAEAIKELLQKVDVEELAIEMRQTNEGRDFAAEETQVFEAAESSRCVQTIGQQAFLDDFGCNPGHSA